MWQLLWKLTAVPDWIYHAILITGVIGLVAGRFLQFAPVTAVYAPVVRTVSAVLVVAGIWFNGFITSDAKWQERVADLESKIAESEQRAADANAEIEIQYVDRVKVVKEKEYIIQSEIREYSGDIDANCVVSPKAREILNQAAQSPDRGNSQ